ncbi:MAG: M23 family metallopeptidase, partial [Ilumatobacteraceae bacterium]
MRNNGAGRTAIGHDARSARGPRVVLAATAVALAAAVASLAGTTAPTSIAAGATTTVAPVAPVVIKQFPVQGVCYFSDTYGAPRSGGRTHEGVDIIAKAGLFLYAADDGTLTKQYIDAPGALAGNGWRLTRADGTYFFYAHLSAFAPGLKVGSVVKAGQILGNVGMTGNAGTPHLHFEVHPRGGVAVNPTPIVKAVDGCKVTTVPAQPGTGATTTVPATTPPTVAPTTVAPTT